MAVKDEVIDIVVEQLGVDRKDVDESKKFIDDLNADSLDLTELIMTLESKFEMEITEEEAETLKSVGDAIQFIEKKRSS